MIKWAVWSIQRTRVRLAIYLHTYSGIHLSFLPPVFSEQIRDADAARLKGKWWSQRIPRGRERGGKGKQRGKEERAASRCWEKTVRFKMPLTTGHTPLSRCLQRICLRAPMRPQFSAAFPAAPVYIRAPRNKRPLRGVAAISTVTIACRDADFRSPETPPTDCRHPSAIPPPPSDRSSRLREKSGRKRFDIEPICVTPGYLTAKKTILLYMR